MALILPTGTQDLNLAEWGSEGVDRLTSVVAMGNGHLVSHWNITKPRWFIRGSPKWWSGAKRNQPMQMLPGFVASQRLVCRMFWTAGFANWNHNIRHASCGWTRTDRKWSVMVFVTSSDLFFRFAFNKTGWWIFHPTGTGTYLTGKPVPPNMVFLVLSCYIPIKWWTARIYQGLYEKSQFCWLNVVEYPH